MRLYFTCHTRCDSLDQLSQIVRIMRIIFMFFEKNIKKLSEKNSQLKEKFNDLIQYLRTNSIEVPNFKNY